VQVDAYPRLTTCSPDVHRALTWSSDDPPRTAIAAVHERTMKASINPPGDLVAPQSGLVQGGAAGYHGRPPPLL